MTPLISYLSRYMAGTLEASLKGPVLVVEPHPAKNAPEHRFRTESGVGTPTPGPGDTYVLEIRKHKNNAFQRGVTVGRTANNDLVIDDASVSRFHAWFQRDVKSGRWSIADAGSKNGTLLGRSKLVPKKPSPLAGRERVRFGKVATTFLQPKDFAVFLAARAS